MDARTEFPKWLQALSDEDLQFLKRFILSSGSLKALAQEYDISYPTVRTRLDRLIEKVKAADRSNYEDEFHRVIQILAADGSVAPSIAKQLIKAHKKSVQAKENSNE